MNRVDVWRQSRVPVLYLAQKGLFVRLPYFEGSRDWLQGDKRNHPKWLKKSKAWGVPKAWFDDLARRLVVLFGQCYLLQEVREREVCAPACWDAKGLDCCCSCMGANHGSGHPGGRWREVSEAFAVSYGDKKLSCRLLMAASKGN